MFLGLDLTNKRDLNKSKKLHKEYYNVKNLHADLGYLFEQAMTEVFFPPDLHILLEVNNFQSFFATIWITNKKLHFSLKAV